MNFKDRFSIKSVLISIMILCALILTILIFWGFSISGQIQKKIAGGWFNAPINIYASGDKIKINHTLRKADFLNYMQKYNYKKITARRRIHQGEYSFWKLSLCQSVLSSELPEDSKQCFVFKDTKNNFNMFITSDQQKLVSLFQGEPPKAIDQIILEPQLITQLFNNKPLKRIFAPLNNFPIQCIQAITAIEDNNFLEHQGVSIKGLFRAFYVNFTKGRLAQGGSTITQQLIKNYFLTSERTLKRKFTEMVMAIVLENLTEKEKILESYLNVIYMGQSGPFEVRGFASAAEFYFNKKLSDLNTGECASLSAIVNSPGRYNPFKHIERTTQRRNLVLRNMNKYGYLDNNQLEEELFKPVKVTRYKHKTPLAPYYIQAVKKSLSAMDLPTEKGLNVYTGLSPKAQTYARKALSGGLDKLESWYKHLVENKKQGLDLQGTIISIDIKTGEVLALLGGRSFRTTQYNRAIESHRQAGSIMKPFVYLAALEAMDENGNTYGPLSLIEDKKFTHKYEGQSWSPINYNKYFRGTIPLYYGLKNSINAATARLGLDVGLSQVIDVATRAGIKSELKPFPSITLGAFELFPIEVAQAYLTLARFGNYKQLSLIQRITNLNNEELYSHPSETHQVIAKETTAELISMLKQTLKTGTAKVTQKLGFYDPAAGKTGTTSDAKDTWFVGFTPGTLTLVWVGYDNNETTGLTGASAAAPIWTEYMKKYSYSSEPEEFTWPEGLTEAKLSKDYLKSLFSSSEEAEKIKDDVYMVFRNETLPDTINSTTKDQQQEE